MTARTLCTLSIFALLLSLASISFAADPPKIAGLTFASKEKFEVGRGVGGPAMGTWKLTFTDTKVRWRYSDVVESFDYTIDGDGKITATSAMRKNAKLGGQYDPATKELTWEGKVYVQE